MVGGSSLKEIVNCESCLYYYVDLKPSRQTTPPSKPEKARNGVKPKLEAQTKTKKDGKGSSIRLVAIVLTSSLVAAVAVFYVSPEVQHVVGKLHCNSHCNCNTVPLEENLFGLADQTHRYAAQPETFTILNSDFPEFCKPLIGYL